MIATECYQMICVGREKACDANSVIQKTLACLHIWKATHTQMILKQTWKFYIPILMLLVNTALFINHEKELGAFKF